MGSKLQQRRSGPMEKKYLFATCRHHLIVTIVNMVQPAFCPGSLLRSARNARSVLVAIIKKLRRRRQA
jgi:hypothetical protein